jgi:hypothetical protein
MARLVDEDFRRKYPHLANELGGAETVNISAVRSSADEAEKTTIRSPVQDPTAIDFIRRCNNENQALEIINFMEGKGDIKPDYAKQLRAQLAEKGLSSFGKRKEPGYYIKGEG